MGPTQDVWKGVSHGDHIQRQNALTCLFLDGMGSAQSILLPSPDLPLNASVFESRAVSSSSLLFSPRCSEAVSSSCWVPSKLHSKGKLSLQGLKTLS